MSIRACILLSLVLSTSATHVVAGLGEGSAAALLDSCNAALHRNDHAQALRFLGDGLKMAEAAHDMAGQARLLMRRSDIWFERSEYGKALMDLQAALPLYESLQDTIGIATAYNAFGSVHFYDKNYPKAYLYYQKSLHTLAGTDDSSQMATTYGNMGAALQEMGELDSALAYLRRHLSMRVAAGQERWLPICYINLGSCLERMGRLDSARHYLEAGLAAYDRLDGRGSGYLDGLRLLGLVHLRAGHHGTALRLCRTALDLALKAGDLPLQEGCYNCLYETYNAMGDAPGALAMFRQYAAIRDSISGAQRNKELIRLELTYNFERERVADSLKQADKEHQASMAYQYGLSQERYQKRAFLVGALAILLLAMGLWRRLRYIQRSRKLIQRERDRSDGLLLNILPKPIAEELKANGRVQVREVGEVSILFTDFNEFTKISERLSPQALVAEIDTCYRAFDVIAAQYGIEKIKTIGDAYMCAGGLPEPRPQSAADTVRAALAMQEWLKGRAAMREELGLPAFHMRAGIHTGTVVAGVVGKSKFQYDVWGDTVNTAARMEAAGTVGEVNVSKATMEMVRHEAGLLFIPRGEVNVKGKGEMAMYFVRSGSQARHTAGMAMDPAVA